MQTLTDALALRLACQPAPASPASNAWRHLSGQDQRRQWRWPAARRAVVLALPAWAAADLTASLAPRASAALTAITYPPVAVVVSAYRKRAIAHPLDGFGFLVPRREGRRILGTIFSSTLFGNRAPPGFDLITTFVGGMRQPPGAVGGRAIAELAQAERGDLGAARATVRVRCWPRAIRST
jgi:oxygen-dependent protoporphyrinogen oxidase